MTLILITVDLMITHMAHASPLGSILAGRYALWEPAHKLDPSRKECGT
jgi:hypothetical protein